MGSKQVENYGPSLSYNGKPYASFLDNSHRLWLFDRLATKRNSSCNRTVTNLIWCWQTRVLCCLGRGIQEATQLVTLKSYEKFKRSKLLLRFWKCQAIAILKAWLWNWGQAFLIRTIHWKKPINKSIIRFSRYLDLRIHNTNK